MRDPTTVTHPDLKAITVFLASTATPARGGLPYLDAVLPAEDRLAATRVVRDLGALPPDAILYLLAQPLLDLASDHLTQERDLTTRYEARFEQYCTGCTAHFGIPDPDDPPTSAHTPHVGK